MALCFQIIGLTYIVGREAFIVWIVRYGFWPPLWQDAVAWHTADYKTSALSALPQSYINALERYIVVYVKSQNNGRLLPKQAQRKVKVITKAKAPV